MKNLPLIIIFFLLIGCSNNKQVYWCGDHACVNKKEREEYFKKNMIVEVRNYDESKKMSQSEIKAIEKQIKLDEKKRLKKNKNIARDMKAEKKRQAKEAKRLKKQAKLEEKKRIAEEKRLKKLSKLEKKRKKDKKKKEKKINMNIIKNESVKTNSSFTSLVEKVKKKNLLKEYPDISKTPE